MGGLLCLARRFNAGIAGSKNHPIPPRRFSPSPSCLSPLFSFPLQANTNVNTQKMSLNKVILIGNVGRDPEVRYFDNNVAVANFPLATSERGYTLANGTVIPERTEWHNIVVRRDLVQFVEKWVKKGSGLYVEGKIRTRTYDDAQGIKRYVTEIYADRVEFYSTGSRPADSTQQSQQQPAATTYAQPAKPAAPAASEPDEPDDLPF